jgi:hypothetical protein
MPERDASESKVRSWGALLRLWVLLFLSYATLKVIFNIVYSGYIDLRPAFFWEIALLPIGQSLIVWLVARGRRQRARVEPAADA